MTGSGKTLCFVLPIVTRLIHSTRGSHPPQVHQQQQPEQPEQPHQGSALSEQRVAWRSTRKELFGNAALPTSSAAPPISSNRVCAPSVLVLAPTRELCIQSFNEFKALIPKRPTSQLDCVAIYGGVPYDKQGCHTHTHVHALLSSGFDTNGPLHERKKRNCSNVSQPSLLVVLVESWIGCNEVSYRYRTFKFLFWTRPIDCWRVAPSMAKSLRLSVNRQPPDRQWCFLLRFLMVCVEALQHSAHTTRYISNQRWPRY
jgi:hypothetical protein